MGAAHDLANALSDVRPEQRVTVAHWKRLLGVRWIDGHSWRCTWGEVAWKWHLPMFNVSGFDDKHNTLCLGLLFCSVYIDIPMWLIDGYDIEKGYGFSFTHDALHMHWCERTKLWDYPWSWRHVRHSFLNADGSVHHHESRGAGFEREPEETKERHRYTYVLHNCKRQDRIATINGEEREWRWRWFTWLPYPRNVSRTINVNFDDEVGEKAGSYKGGCTGCSYEWKSGETLEQALRRMEIERKF